MENQWKHLGIGNMRRANDLSRGFLLVHIAPEKFREFMSSANVETKDTILRGGDVDATYAASEDLHLQVSLSFHFIYILTSVDGDGDGLCITSQNVESVLDSEPQYQCNGVVVDEAFLEGLNPTSASVTVSPYNAFHHGHCQGVDTIVTYRWINMNDLHLRIAQDPIPEVPMYAPMNDWNLLGRGLLSKRDQMKNQLVLGDVDAFLESIPMGQMRGRILSGSGVRVTCLYTSEQQFRGLQIKRIAFENQPPKLVLSLGSLLQFHSGFRYKHLEALYRWRGPECLELVIQVKQT